MTYDESIEKKKKKGLLFPSLIAFRSMVMWRWWGDYECRHSPYNIKYIILLLQLVMYYTRVVVYRIPGIVIL